MEFCGRCGHELGRGIERGRFCPKCGHETPGNARYPLYADGTPAVTRQRPHSVTPSAAELTVVRPGPRTTPPRATAPTPSEASGAVQPAGDATATTAVRPVDVPADATRRRLRTLDHVQSDPARSDASWKVALAATLTAMLVLILLGFFLMLH